MGEIVPHAAPEQFAPVTVHVTPRFDGSFATVATSGNVPLICTEPDAGEIDTDAGSVGMPLEIVICPTILQFAEAGQFMVMGLFNGDNPVPLKVAPCGEPGALSEMLTFAEREPIADGVNVVTMVQVAPAATFAPLMHVLVGETVKSPGVGPLSVALLEKVRTEFPVFVSVIVCDALVVATVEFPNSTLDGETVTCADITGGGAVTMSGFIPSVS